MFLVHKTSRFILKNIFLFVFSIFLSSFFIAPVYAQVTENFVVTSGVDKSSGTAKDFTANEIERLSISDSEPGGDVDRVRSDKWPDADAYDEERYLEFVFSPNIPDNAIISNVSVTNEYRNSNTTEIHHAKLEIWDGVSFIDREISVSLDTNDITDNIDISSILNSPEKVNNTKIRFLAYRDKKGQAHTSHDFIKLAVVYDVPLPPEPDPEPDPVFTEVSSDITEDTIWTLDKSPYVIKNDIVVFGGVTLTIEPGVVVKFNPSTHLNIWGSLSAQGLDNQNIHFTSILDDSLGGDTNGDGTLTKPDILNNRSMFSGIYFDNSDSININNISVNFSRNGLYFFLTQGTISNFKGRNNLHDLQLDLGSNITLLGGDFYGSLYESIYLIDSVLTAQNIIIENTKNYQSIITFNSDLFLKDSLIQNTENNRVQAIGAEGPGNIFLDNVTLKNNLRGVVGYEKIVFNIKDSLFDNTGIVTWGESTFNINNTTIQNSFGILDFGEGDTFNIEKSNIINNINGIYIYDNAFFPNTVFNIKDSNISDNTEYGVYNKNNYNVNFENMWWGDPSGPYHLDSNSEGLGNSVSDNILFSPWLTSWPPEPIEEVCEIDCFSNVLFLPGIQGSRLYGEILDCEDVVSNSLCGEKQFWISVNDLYKEKLALNDEGKSINDIYTKNDTENLDEDNNETGILDKIIALNIYKSFINDLRDWKKEGLINDYDFIPYDWRLSLEDIILNGKIQGENLSYRNVQEFEESFILKKLEELQESSKDGKVTIITHSNGGLVAKALVQKLKDTGNPLYEKIDKIIFIGVPQIGTPDAIPVLLHGINLGEGFVLSKERSRSLAENMPAIYNFLPSDSYFTVVDPSFAIDKVLSFENKSFFEKQTSLYGIFVSDEMELKNYLLGGDERIKPDYKDTKNPSIGNSFLYEQAQNTHKILDSWMPHPNTKVIQVAGWGEETLAGIDYVTRKKFLGEEYISYKPKMVIDGDGTVVIPSALWMPVSENIERWWVDLKTNNFGLNKNRNHKDMLEIQNLRDFIKSKIKESDFVDIEKIILNTNSSLISNDARLHFTLHSPLTLGIIDSEGRYTGLDPITKEIKEEIPGVSYRQIGEVQFLSIPVGIEYTLKLQGDEEGSFSLDIEKQEGNDILEYTSFQAIPSDSNTLATLSIGTNFKIGDSVLNIDSDGDNKIDISLKGAINSTTLYEEPEKETINLPISQNNLSPPGAVNIFAFVQNNIENKIEEVEKKENQNEIKEYKNIIKEDISKKEIIKIKVSKDNFSNKNSVLKEEKREDLIVENDFKNNQNLEDNLALEASAIKSNTNNRAKWPVIILSFIIIGIFGFKFIRV